MAFKDLKKQYYVERFLTPPPTGFETELGKDFNNWIIYKLIEKMDELIKAIGEKKNV